jgi:Na+/proline symporter
VYSTSDQIGSFSKMHSLLTEAAKVAPVPGNKNGSYLTMRSRDGLVFGVINTVGNFATVFQDQA